MKKTIGVLMKFVPIIFFFVPGFTSDDKTTQSVARTIYMVITIAMFWGILEMVTDKKKIPKMKNWTRVADIILLILFATTATNDFLHRHDANVTRVNSLLMFFCSAMLYLHEKVRDQRVAKLLEATKVKSEHRGLGEPSVTD